MPKYTADYYRILEVERTATADEIRLSYRKLCLRHHPDKAASQGISEEESVSKFQKIQEAYETLSDESKREEYDSYFMGGGASSSSSSSSSSRFSSGGAFFDFDFTRSKRHQPDSFMAPRPSKKSPVRSVHYVDVTINDLFAGTEKILIVSRSRPCAGCDGYGYPKSAFAKRCWKCDGDGRIIVAGMAGPFMHPVFQTCPVCDGVKYIITDTCTACRGEKVFIEKTSLPVNFPPGTSPDREFLYPLQGDQLADWQYPGDLILKLRVVPHKTMSITKNPDTGLLNDLSVSITLTFSESFMGFDRVILRHLDGQQLRYESPAPGQAGWHAFREGEIFRIKGQGLSLNAPDHTHAGDIVVNIHVESPSEDWASQMTSQNLKQLDALLPPKRDDIKMDDDDDIDIYVKLESSTK